MTAWLKAHPTGLDYCTTLKIPSELGGFDLGFEGGSFYQPSPVFTQAAKHPILAIEKENAPGSAVLAALVKAGLVRAEPVKYTTFTQSFSANGKWNAQPAYHYATTARTAYVITGIAGWQITTAPINIAALPSNPEQQPQLAAVNVAAIPAGPNPMSPAWCGGAVSVKKITEYTAPASELGLIVSTAKAILTVSGLPAWLTDPAITPALSSPPEAEYKGQADFEKTSNGWELTGGVRGDGLFGTGDGL